ncbi:MAG TPA: hypothetical protein ENJ93_02935, partial [Chloroflexi bacterium]|nr:hypothetical protein [Chloroflexota bacterium]
TSSFYAVRKSLERRRDWLQGQIEFGEAFTLEDEADLEELDELEQAGLDLYGLDPTLPLTPGQLEQFQAELDYLDSFIVDLRSLSQGDSKINQLKDELNRIFRQRPTVIIFTQYTDTMDYLREQLQAVYRGKVACYSGRGGETWNGITWVPTPKEVVKNRFREGEIKILLATESASEGLNLQTCGVLINYDMPWNPMRVEQRIGRIDRIGQTYEQVWIYNYFYRDTIEDRIYQALADRISWFEDVVGNLQPILADVNQITRNLAMLPAERQAAELEQAIRRLREEIDRARMEALNLDDYLYQGDPAGSIQSPVTLADLETMLTQSQATRHLFHPHPDITNAYWLAWQGDRIAVTFDAAQFDQYPDTLHFLSYGSPILAEILNCIPAPESYPEQLARFTAEAPLPVRAWYDLRGDQPQPVGSFTDLRRLVRETAVVVPADRAAAAQKLFVQKVQVITTEYQQRLVQLANQQQGVLQAKARRLLEKAALVEIALGQQRSLFEAENYPTSFSETAVSGLKRHKSPWSWLLVAAAHGDTPLPKPQRSDPFFEQIRNDSPEKLKALFMQLTNEARPIAQAWKGMA